MASNNTSAEKVDTTLPSADMLKACADVPLFSEEGKETSFRSLIEGDGDKRRHMIIFIRHFFCGLCQDYVTALSEELVPASLPADTRLTIVGCGYHDLIPDYAKATKCAYPMYTDPTGRLYNALHMTSTLEFGKAAQYNKNNIFLLVMRSMYQVFAWGGGRQATRAGHWKQVGGEFLFERTEGQDSGMGEWGVTFCHRMRHTRDHMEVAQLRRLLCDGELGNDESRLTGNVDVKIKDFGCADGRCDVAKGKEKPGKRSDSLLGGFRRTSSNKASG